MLIYQLDGFIDAGQAGRLFTSHVIEQLEHEVLAEFDHDQLHDYRSRRPVMIYDTNQWKSYAELQLRLYRVVDEHGEVFLLLTGPEPDMQWERMAAAVIGLVEQFDVRLSVNLHGIPMAVPHTRPVTLTAHSTDPALVNGYRNWIDRVEVPGSFAGPAGVPARSARPGGARLRGARPALSGSGVVPGGDPAAHPVAEPGDRAGRADRAAGEGVGARR